MMTFYRKKMIALFFAVLFSAGVYAECSDPVSVPRFSAVNLKLDGIPNEPFWQRAALIQDFRTWRKFVPSAEKTKVFLCMDSKNLYVALLCEDSRRIQPQLQGKSIWSGDSAELFFAGLTYPEWYRQIVIAPGGTEPYLEFIYPHDFQYKTSYSAKKWSAELVIPLDKLGTDARRSFRFNMFRKRGAAGKLLTWKNVSWGHCFQDLGELKVIDPADEITHGPWSCAVTSNSAVIRWETAGVCTQNLYWRLRGEDKFIRVSADVVAGTQNCSCRIHRAVLNGLKPGCEYEYCIRQGETHTFRTLQPGKGDFSFCMFSDIHSRYKEFQQMMQWQQIKESELLFLNGDMVTGIAGRNVLYDAFLDSMVKYYRGIWYYLRGNHESRGNSINSYFELFTGPDLKGYRAFSHKGVYFILLDTDADMKCDSAYIKEQQKWLQQQVLSEAFQKAEFRILINHVPQYRFKRGNIPEIVQMLKTLPAEKTKMIDLMLSGHVHSYSRIRPGEKFFSQSPGLMAAFSDTAIPCPSVTNTFCGIIQVRKTADRLIVSGFDKKGLKIENFSLQKKIK